MSGQEALEDLRSKIIASMQPGQTKENAGKRGIAHDEDNDAYASDKRQRANELPKGPRNSSGSGRYVPSRNNVSGINQGNQSRYGGANTQMDSRRSGSRFNTGERTFSRLPAGSSSGINTYNGRREYHERSERSYTPSKFQHSSNNYLQDVTPIDQRRRMGPTRWDVTPKGFEKVPVERAKLSGLFPQPGQPQELDHYKLERVALHGGAKSRRTRILFDDTTSNNLTISRMGCRLVVERKDSDNNGGTSELEQFLTRFVSSLGENYEIKSFSHDSTFDMIEFNSAECTTLVFASKSFVNREVKLENVEWRRPNEYVQQLDHPDRMCGPDIIALEGLSDREQTEQLLNDNGIKFNYCQPIFHKDNGVDLFTKCALVEICEMNENALNNLKTVTWFKPNQSALTQNSSSITFQTLPQLVKEERRQKSRVIKLFNCVDPLDLKYDPYYEEIEESLKEMLEEVEIIWIKKPNVNYRLNFENIGEDVGNIYVKFNTMSASEKAMGELPSRKINGRTVLCSYFDEHDFNLVRYN